jgi:hypothetical protein
MHKGWIAPLWLLRLLIGGVLLVNVQCAASFLLWPGRYAPAYELSGITGAAMIRAVGVLFLMWNVPYAFAFAHPRRFPASLVEAAIMQAMGLVGESLILLGLPPGHETLAASLLRFIFFDAGGLVLLFLALRWR